MHTCHDQNHDVSVVLNKIGVTEYHLVASLVGHKGPHLARAMV